MTEDRGHRMKRNKKVAGEYHAIKHITHRPSQTQTDGLCARIKAVFTIQQTERQNKIGGKFMKH
jgi:hypothetical protein